MKYDYAQCSAVTHDGLCGRRGECLRHDAHIESVRLGIDNRNRLNASTCVDGLVPYAWVKERKK